MFGEYAPLSRVSCALTLCLEIRDAPFDIWGGGGGLEFLLLAKNFFFYLRWKTSYFFGDQRPTILCFVEEMVRPLCCMELNKKVRQVFRVAGSIYLVKCYLVCFK